MNDRRAPNTLLRVQILRVKNCECYVGGEDFTFRWPFVLPDMSGKLCSLFLASLAPLMEEILAGREPTGYKRTGDVWLVTCKSRGCKIAVRITRDIDTSRTERITARRPSRLAEELVSLPLFEGMDPVTLFELTAAVRTRTLREGEPMLREGERGRRLLIILKGTAAVLGHDEDGSEHCLALLGRGDVVGEMSLISGAPASATVVAQGECTVAEIGETEFNRLMNEHAGFAMYFARLLCERLRSSNRQFIALLEQGVTGKLSTVTLPELCQIIKLNDRSGLVRLSSGEKTGLLYFKNGELMNALTGRLSGEAAFFELLEWKEGDFQFEAGVFEGEREIFADVMALILEAMRQRDETAR